MKPRYIGEDGTRYRKEISMIYGHRIKHLMSFSEDTFWWCRQWYDER
jgi:hypothetical protein